MFYKNGMLFEKFELELPRKCEIHKPGKNILELKHPLFKLILTYSFTEFNTVFPRNFEKFYMHRNLLDIIGYHANIKIELKLSWKSLFIRKSCYYEWIDKYIQNLIDDNSFKQFIDSIQWNIVETIIEHGNKDTV